MNDGLKQRIIGAIVLLAIAVIFVPVLFDREKIIPVDRKTQIPIAPFIESNPVPKPILPIEEVPIREMVKAPEDIFIPDETKPETLEPEAPGLDEKGVPKSWVLQVASFSSEGAATALRDKLIKAGHESYTRNVKTSSIKVTRVYVGPNFQKSKMVDAKNVIDKEFKVASILLKYKP